MAMSFPNISRALSMISRGDARSSLLESFSKSTTSTTLISEVETKVAASEVADGTVESGATGDWLFLNGSVAQTGRNKVNALLCNCLVILDPTCVR